jgi:hypothetical protein
MVQLLYYYQNIVKNDILGLTENNHMNPHYKLHNINELYKLQITDC